LRHRLLFLGQRADLGDSPEPPGPTHCAGNHCTDKCGREPGRYCKLEPTPTVLESLRGLPTLDSGQAAEYLNLGEGKVLLNGSTMNHSTQVIKKIKAITAGAGPISYRPPDPAPHALRSRGGSHPRLRRRARLLRSALEAAAPGSQCSAAATG
jgi:hypothetical protein